MELIGHENLFSYFTDLFKKQKFCHAYLFLGPQSTGKQTFALHFVKCFLCLGESSASLFGESNSNAKPCNNCESCRLFDLGLHPDVLVLKKEEDLHEISIKQMREVLHKAYRSPSMSSKKFLVLPDSHLLSTAASNAFLKTLEEPPASCVLILTTHKPESLPQTIHSRCQIFEFGSVSAVPEDPNDHQLWQRSRYLPGIYKNLKDNNQDRDELNEEIERFLRLILLSKGGKLSIIEKWFSSSRKHSQKKDEWQKRLTLWQYILRDFLMLQLGLDELVLYKETKDYASVISIQEIQHAIDLIRSLQEKIDTNINIRIHLESLSLSLASSR